MKYETFIVVNINVGVYLPNCTGKCSRRPVLKYGITFSYQNKGKFKNTATDSFSAMTFFKINAIHKNR
jgi:hypothetical protein